MPENLDDALPAMRASTRLRPNERIVVGWEISGLGPRRENATFELSLSAEGAGFFRRIGRWLRVAGPDTPVRVGWEEPGPSEIGPWFRSVEINLPDVDAGPYVLRLEVATPGRETLVETRVVEIVR